MTLKAKLTAEEHAELGDDVQAFYKETAAGFVLDTNVEDHPGVAALQTTLDRYKALGSDARKLERRLEEADRIKAAVADLGDLDEVKSKLERLETLEAGGDVDQRIRVLQTKLDNAKEEQARAVSEKDQEIRDRDSFIERMVVDRAFDHAFTKEAAEKNVGHVVVEELRAGAKSLLRSQAPVKVERVDTAQGPEYRAVIDGDMGEEPIGDYVARWGRTEAAKAYSPASGNRGFDSKNGGGGGGGGSSNPWSEKHWNLTEQGKIAQENPALAKRLANAEGKTLNV